MGYFLIKFVAQTFQKAHSGHTDIVLFYWKSKHGKMPKSIILETGQSNSGTEAEATVLLAIEVEQFSTRNDWTNERHIRK